MCQIQRRILMIGEIFKDTSLVWTFTRFSTHTVSFISGHFENDADLNKIYVLFFRKWLNMCSRSSKGDLIVWTVFQVQIPPNPLSWTSEATPQTWVWVFVCKNVRCSQTADIELCVSLRCCCVCLRCLQCCWRLKCPKLNALPLTALIFIRVGKLPVAFTPSPQKMDRCRSTVRWSSPDSMKEATGRYLHIL